MPPSFSGFFKKPQAVVDPKLASLFEELNAQKEEVGSFEPVRAVPPPPTQVGAAVKPQTAAAPPSPIAPPPAQAVSIALQKPPSTPMSIGSIGAKSTTAPAPQAPAVPAPAPAAKIAPPPAMANPFAAIAPPPTAQAAVKPPPPVQAGTTNPPAPVANVPPPQTPPAVLAPPSQIATRAQVSPPPPPSQVLALERAPASSPKALSPTVMQSAKEQLSVQPATPTKPAATPIPINLDRTDSGPDLGPDLGEEMMGTARADKQTTNTIKDAVAGEGKKTSLAESLKASDAAPVAPPPPPQGAGQTPEEAAKFQAEAAKAGPVAPPPPAPPSNPQAEFNALLDKSRASIGVDSNVSEMASEGKGSTVKNSMKAVMEEEKKANDAPAAFVPPPGGPLSAGAPQGAGQTQEEAAKFQAEAAQKEPVAPPPDFGPDARNKALLAKEFEAAKGGLQMQAPAAIQEGAQENRAEREGRAAELGGPKYAPRDPTVARPTDFMSYADYAGMNEGEIRKRAESATAKTNELRKQENMALQRAQKEAGDSSPIEGTASYQDYLKYKQQAEAAGQAGAGLSVSSNPYEEALLSAYRTQQTSREQAANAAETAKGAEAITISRNEQRQAAAAAAAADAEKFEKDGAARQAELERSGGKSDEAIAAEQYEAELEAKADAGDYAALLELTTLRESKDAAQGGANVGRKKQD